MIEAARSAGTAYSTQPAIPRAVPAPTKEQIEADIRLGKIPEEMARRLATVAGDEKAIAFVLNYGKTPTEMAVLLDNAKKADELREEQNRERVKFERDRVIAAVRQRIRELRAELQRLQSAPMSEAERKAAIAQIVTVLKSMAQAMKAMGEMPALGAAGGAATAPTAADALTASTDAGAAANGDTSGGDGSSDDGASAEATTADATTSGTSTGTTASSTGDEEARSLGREAEELIKDAEKRNRAPRERETGV